MRGNNPEAAFPAILDQFQFTPLHERQLVNPREKVGTWYFNSRLYMRGNKYQCGKCGAIYISIHASTWEATESIRHKHTTSFYFNSRLYMRGNNNRPGKCRWFQNFNSRLYMRGNANGDRDAGRHQISIHASTWEATAKTYNLFDKIDIIFYQTLFFYSNFSESSLFFNSSSIFLINCIFLPAPMSHKKMYESHQRTHF